MAIKLASLFIQIGANGDQLTAELTKTRKQTTSWSKNVKKATDVAVKGFTAVTVTAGLVSTALTAVYVSSSRSLDNLGKTAAKLGDTTQDLRVFGLAAEYGGVGVDSANTALQRMTRRLAEAANGTGEAKNAIAELGLDADRLSSMRPSQAFEEISAALEGIPNASDRVRLAMKFFDSEGVALVNVTRDVLQKARDDVDAFGGALTNLEIAQVEAANDAVTTLWAGFGLLADRFTLKVAPGVEAVANQLFDSAKQGQQLSGVMDGLILGTLQGISGLASASASVLRVIDGREEVASFGLVGYLLFGKKGFVALATLGYVKKDIVEIVDDMRLKFSGTASTIEVLEDKIESLRRAVSARNSDAQLPLIGGFFEGQADKAKEELAEAEAEMARLTSGIPIYARALDENVNFTSAAADGLATLAASLDEVIAKYGQVSNLTALTAPIGTGGSGSNNGGAANDEEYEPSGLFKSSDSAIGDFKRDQAVQEIESLAQLRQDYFASQLAEEKRFQNTLTLFQSSGAKDRLSILFKESSGALSTLAQGSRKIFELNKAFGLADATVSIATGIASSLKVGGWAGFGMAAKVALEGAAQIKTITSAEYGKGAVTAPGSSGGENPVTNVGSTNSSAPTGDALTSTSSDSEERQQGGLRPIIFTTPGASEEQRAAEIARGLAKAAELDLYGTDEDGNPIYNGSDDVGVAA